ncbi:MAG TPA: ABC transporter substrate-binding protein [Acidocella sp.]|nr:ABC transporter substrate-binding protein [Acidocella sp.]
MTTTRRTIIKAAFAAPALLGTRNAFAATPLSLQASWVNDAEFLGYFVAMDSKLYDKAGLALNYIPGGPDVIPESTLLAGKADIALTTPDTTIKAITDSGAQFRIIGAQYQKNPLGVISLAKSNINKPADLVGKILAVPPVNTLSVNAMFKMNGIDPSSVKIVPYEYDPTPLIKGEVDATIDFATDVPFTIKQTGVEPASFLLYDYGFTIYNDTVVVTLDTLKTKRAALVKFLRASRAGWQENFKDPAAYPPKFANSYFQGTGRTTANDVYTNTADKPLIDTPKGIFAMTEADIAANIKALESIGIKAKREYFDTSLLAEI